MDEHFIGIGPNPNPGEPDLPLGFGMRLMQNAAARARFESLSPTEKQKVVAFVESGATGEEAKGLMEEAIRRLNTK